MKKLLAYFYAVCVSAVAVLVLFAFSSGKQRAEGERRATKLTYVEGGGESQTLDLYLPAGVTKAPLLVWIHGGGWVGGNKAHPPGLPLVAKGYALASINYRYSSQAVFPAQIEDCKAAIRWLRAHAAEYGIDPKRVAVWGASAGGHLTALLAVTGQVRDFDVGANLDQSSAIQCAIDWFGPTDFPNYKLPPQTSGYPASLLTMLLGGTISEKMDLARKASPMSWVTKQAAPLLILHGSRDPLVPLDQSERFAARLKAAGSEVTLDILEGAAHGGRAFNAPDKTAALEAFLQRHLGAAR